MLENNGSLLSPHGVFPDIFQIHTCGDSTELNECITILDAIDTQSGKWTNLSDPNYSFNSWDIFSNWGNISAYLVARPHDLLPMVNGDQTYYGNYIGSYIVASVFLCLVGLLFGHFIGFGLIRKCARFYDFCCPYRKRKPLFLLPWWKKLLLTLSLWLFHILLWVTISVLLMYFCKTILSPTQFGNAIGRAIGAVYDVVYNPNYDGVNLSSLLGNMVYLQTVVQEYRTNYEEFALTQGGLKVPPSILQEPTVPTCFSPMLKTLTDTPLGTGRQLPLTNIYSRDPYDPNELWFSQLTYQDLLREVIDEDSNVISITDWPCNASTVLMDSIRDPLNKKWSWGRIARSIGTSKNDLLEPQLIKLPYRYSGVLPMTCMSVDDAQPICSLTRLVDANPTNTIEDHFIGTCESYSQAILPLLSDAELSGIDSDAVISKESRSDRNPLNYLFRINDLYGNIDSNGAVDETLPTGPVNGSLISFDPLVTAFDQVDLCISYLFVVRSLVQVL